MSRDKNSSADRKQSCKWMKTKIVIYGKQDIVMFVGKAKMVMDTKM